MSKRSHNDFRSGRERYRLVEFVQMVIALNSDPYYRLHIMSMETVGTHVSKWGEGPIWFENKLFYVDIEGHTVCSFDPETGEEMGCAVGERVGFVLPRKAGGFVIGGDSGISFLNTETGTKTHIVDPEPDKKPANRFNDAKCDPSGRIWAGTISTVKKEGDAALYCLNSNLELSLKYPNVTNSNGLCWTRDKSKFYYIDTPSKKIRVFDFDDNCGEISNEAIAIDTSDIEGSPDGMTIDENDNIWVAFCRGGCVKCFNPQTGDVLETLELPVSGVTSCVFGGENFDTLYITTGQFANLDEELAGRVFATKPGVRGLPTVAYVG
ncbi:MAG: SMP-30/gluconolactonase/LRE family protein [Verrucomicrobiales bacterium]|nr:SMP-30/gluconolactonase/LRE family protein [Verrucomicrobiales bacterium]